MRPEVKPSHPITGLDLGPEFSIGQEVHGKVTIRCGPGLQRTMDGRIRRKPRWFASWFDCVVAVVFLVFAMGIGWLLSSWSTVGMPAEAFAFFLISVAVALLFTIAYQLARVGW